jgi:hypothetical protein
MNYNKLLRFIVILLLIVINLYFFRRISFEIGRIIFNNSNFGILEILEKGQKRILLQFIIDIVYVIIIYTIVQILNKEIVFKDYFKLLLIIPFLTDLSDILYDKSCWKPWYKLNEIIWYFPLRLILWILIYYLFRKNLKKISKFEIIIIIIGLIIYTIIKPF